MVIKMDKETAVERVKEIIGEVKFNKVQSCCFNCGISLKRLEKHHIDGRKNSDEVIPLCPNCHQKITYKQNLISPEKRKSTDTMDLIGFQLISHGALMEIIGKQQQKLGGLLMKK